MSSTLPLYSASVQSASSTDVSAIIPGTIFQDEIPPSFVDGAGPEQSFSPSAPTRDGNRTQIEVNSTIQIVLISLGIVVGALFLLGIAAAYYISRKNKLARMEKEEGKSLPPIPDASAEDIESGSPGPHRKIEHRQLQHASSFSSNAMLLGTAEKHGSVRDSTGYGHSRSSTPATVRYPATRKSHPGTTGPTTATGVRSHGHKKRSSYVDVAQDHSRRQSQSHIISPAVMAYRMSMALDPSITGTGSMDLQTGIPAHFLSQSAFMSDTFLPSSTGSFFHDLCASGSSSPPPVPSKDCSPLNSPRNSLSIGVLTTPISEPLVQPTNADAARTPDISYQPPLQPTSPIAPAFDRGASRRSSTVFTADSGSRNEGSPWHRKRASVVVPDGTAPVRLWKEDVAAISTAETSPSSATSSSLSSMAAGPSRVRVFSSEDALQSRYRSGGFSRVAATRNGAAVFEGIAPLHRKALVQRRSLEESSTGSRTFPRRWAAGQIAVDDDEEEVVVQVRHHHATQDSGSFIPQGHASKGASLDDASEEKVIISLPSPRGCLLEAEVEAMEIQEAYGWQQHQHQHQQTHSKGDDECTVGVDSSALEYPYPTVVRRNPKHLRDKGMVSSYRDDYREQEQQQRKSLQQSVVNDSDLSDGSVVPGSNSGRKRPVGLFQSALQRASLYSAARSSRPPSGRETTSFS
ncbi:hypothetical protein KVV02_003223 [Mortierella alpina]|uniref:Uncharacterized protein n=1 Tax=Mortierella alpina TaxID=64518 RepID=A0A9P8A7X8_MORAP|nr:hypothetical protein KVV02_003223 [Mortierella alpina]